MDNHTGPDDPTWSCCGEPIVGSVITDSVGIQLPSRRGPVVTGWNSHVHLHDVVIADKSLLTWWGFLRYKLRPHHYAGRIVDWPGEELRLLARFRAAEERSRLKSGVVYVDDEPEDATRG